MTLLTALFTTGLWKWVAGALGVAGVALASWLHGKSTGAAQASAAADSKVAAAQAQTVQAQASAANAQAQQQAAEAHLDAVQTKTDVAKDVDQMTDAEIKKDVDENWSR